MNTASLATSRSVRCRTFGTMRLTSLSMTIEAQIPSQTDAISPVVDRLMQLIERSRCAAGSENSVELALRESLNNAVLHGNGMDADKLVEVRCRCELGKGVWLTVKDQGKGFDPDKVPNPLAPDRLKSEHGRGIYLMKLSMDQVSFGQGGTEVRLWKGRSAANRR